MDLGNGVMLGSSIQFRVYCHSVRGCARRTCRLLQMDFRPQSGILQCPESGPRCQAEHCLHHLQIAIFVLPTVVLFGWATGHPFTLDLDPLAAIILTMSGRNSLPSPKRQFC